MDAVIGQSLNKPTCRAGVRMKTASEEVTDMMFLTKWSSQQHRLQFSRLCDRLCRGRTRRIQLPEPRWHSQRQRCRSGNRPRSQATLPVAAGACITRPFERDTGTPVQLDRAWCRFAYRCARLAAIQGDAGGRPRAFGDLEACARDGQGWLPERIHARIRPVGVRPPACQS